MPSENTPPRPALDPNRLSLIPPTVNKYPGLETAVSSQAQGATPLDFIKNSLKPPMDVQAAVNKVQAEEAPKEPPPTPPTPEPVKVEPAKEEANDTYDIIPEIVEASPDVAAGGEEATPVRENFKKLKTTLTETHKTLAEKEAELKAAKEKLEKYDRGEIIPDILQEKENKIAELSKYEKIVNFKSSKEYQETIAKPKTALKGQLEKYAKEYSIPVEELEEAATLTSERALNEFLEDKFDSVGALEVKQIINNLRQVDSLAKTIEESPDSHIQNIQEQYQQIEQQRNAERKGKVASRSKAAWVRALGDIQKAGKITPLLYKEGDSQFNQNYSIPLRTKAAQEYGRIVSALAEGGLGEVSDDVLYAMANSALLALASAVQVEAGNAAIKYASEIEENADRVNRLLRPGVGGEASGGSLDSGNPRTNGFQSNEDAIADLMKKHVLK